MNQNIHVHLKSEIVLQQNIKSISDYNWSTVSFSIWMNHSDMEIEEEYFQKEYLKMIEQKEDKDYLSSFVCLKKKLKFQVKRFDDFTKITILQTIVLLHG
jgi:hypothetical protein